MKEGPTEKTKPAAPNAARPKRKRRWGRVLLIVLAILVIFYQPICVALIHAVAIKVAATQNINLSLKIEGTIFTNMSLKNIRATPNNKGPTPVENISIDEVTVNFSIARLLRKGVSELLSSYILRNGYIVVKPVAGTKEQKSDLASTLHGLIQQPALFSNHVELDNLNLVAHIPDGEFAVKGLTLFLDQVLPGKLQIDMLEVPKIRTWHDLHATGSYVNRDLILRGLEIDPQIVVSKFELDASRRAEGINKMDVEGALFGGNADFSLEVHELPGKHKNNANKATADIKSTITNLSLTKVTQYFNVSTPAVGSVSEAAINLTGDPNVPSSWTGSVTTDVGTVKAGTAILDKATLRLDVSKGWANFGTTLFSGTDNVTVQAAGQLPDSLDGFSGSALTGWLDISAPDLHHLAGGVSGGAVTGVGTFDLCHDIVRAKLDIKSAGVMMGQLSLPVAEVKVDMTKLLPPPKTSGTAQQPPPFAGLDSHLDVHTGMVQAAGFAVDSADISVATHDAIVRLDNVAVRRADCALTASGTYTMPADMKSWTAAPANLGFSLDVPAITQFETQPNPNLPNGKVEALGSLTNGPEGYGGDITADVSQLRLRDFAADGLKLNVTISRSVATINTLKFSLNPTDGLSATGHVDLQKPYTYDAAVQASIRDLSKFNALVAGLKGGLGGALNLAWSGKGDAEALPGTGSLQLSLANGKVQAVQAINLAIAGNYSREDINFPTFRLTSSVGDFSAMITDRNDLLRIDQIAIAQAGRPLLSGSLAVPLNLSTPGQPGTLIPPDGPIAANLISSNIVLDSLFPKGQAPASGTGQVSISAAGTINDPDVRVGITGRVLKAKAAATLPPINLETNIALTGKQLALNTRIVEGTAAAPLLSGSVAIPVDLRTPSKPETLVPTTGPIFANLATSDLVIESFFPKGQAPASGIAKVSIAASGSIDQPNVRVNIAARGVKAKAAANVPAINMDTNLLLVAKQLSLNTRVLEAGSKAPLLSGSASIPLDLRTPSKPETLIPENGPIFANLATSDVVLESFFPRGQAPVNGTAKVTIDASGSIEQPNARVTVAARGLRAKAAANLAPASLAADFALLGPRLSLKAQLEQASVSTIQIAGTIPLPLKEVLHTRTIDSNSPVQLSLRMPRSSLGVITRFVPAVSTIQGTAQASVDVAGTLAKPTLGGAVLVDVPAIRLSNPDMPSISGFRADIPFSGNKLTFRQFGGNLSGGSFGLSGTILFANLANPVFDLRATTKEALVVRNESVTVRVNTDVRVSGPLAGASVTGDVGITHSRFFKQIEILPLDLPGRPAPAPPPAPASNPSIDTPPLRDWKFAIRVHTLDPFLVQGNLANGSALVDLNIGGTGKTPTLEGTVRIENFVASLPFSKLTVTNGFVYFKKDDPFVPQINIQATSNLQDYNINVLIYGTAQDPKTVMSSEPPLRQEDIVSLLATGATAANLNSGTGLAGRAAVLLLQSLYHKVFKAKPPTDTDNESFASRFKVNVGGVDARTGQQEISSSFELSKKLYLIGDIDVGGDLRAMIRYLIRFK